MDKQMNEEVEDLKQVLIEFWLGTVRGEYNEAEFPEKLKASEMLAKFVLLDGTTKIKKKGGINRPSTAEILKLTAEMEQLAAEAEEEHGEGEAP